ncbi:hypothetical protein QUB05_24960, partial [Microcoleus sp. F10-C6]|uniref:hypothetical protein n=1 Tax=unclassified Microcoleus TaxID=2642155 RepID=UPI002FCEB2FB
CILKPPDLSVVSISNLKSQISNRMTNNFLMVQASGFIRGINRKHPKSLHPQAPGFIRGVNLKSQISNLKSNDRNVVGS